MSKTRPFFVTICRPEREPLTVTRLACNEGRLQRALVKEFGEGVSFQWSDLENATPPRPICRPETEADWEAEGRRIALESMDLPDGAYFAMAEELGLEP